MELIDIMSLIEEEKINSEKYRLLEEIIEYNKKKVKIVKLTSDNVSRVEAMISTNSDYKQTQIGEDGIAYILHDSRHSIDMSVSEVHTDGLPQRVFLSENAIGRRAREHYAVIIAQHLGRVPFQ